MTAERDKGGGGGGRRLEDLATIPPPFVRGTGERSKISIAYCLAVALVRMLCEAQRSAARELRQTNNVSFQSVRENMVRAGLGAKGANDNTRFA